MAVVNDDAFAQMERALVVQATETIKAFALRLFIDIQVDTRVGQSDGGQHGSAVRTGRYAASHRLSLNTIDSSVAPPVEPYPKHDLMPDQRIVPNPPLSDVQAVLRNFKLGDKIIISNSLDYAKALEDGWSKKAPDGVYGPSLLWEQARYAAAFADLAVEVNAKVREQ